MATIVAALALTIPAAAHAAAPQASDNPPQTWDGPPAPVLPAVVNHDGQGRATMRAFRIKEPLIIDGRLDEEIYSQIPGGGDLIQSVPREGEAAQEKTEAWIFFDDKNLYLVARCWDSHPEREIVNELRRDNGAGINSNEGLTFALDTFGDRRNGFAFQTNPMGLLREQLITDNKANDSWNTVWDARVRRDAQGWSAEFVIPFRSLRYPGPGPQVWGIQIRRFVRWRNEIAHLTRVSASWGNEGSNQVYLYASLVGLETPAESLNLETKPYVLSTVTTDRTARPAVNNNFSPAVGVDVKYGLTRVSKRRFTPTSRRSKKTFSRSTSRASIYSSTRSATSSSKASVCSDSAT